MQQHKVQLGGANQDRQERLLLLHAAEADYSRLPQMQGVYNLFSPGHMQRPHQPPRRSRRGYLDANHEATRPRPNQAAAI